MFAGLRGVRKRAGLCLGLMIVVGLAGCAGVARGERPETPTPAPMGYDGAVDRRTARPGETVELILEGNPTTGYQWSVVRITETALSQDYEESYAPGSTGGTPVVGSGGVYKFQFKAVKAGTSTVELAYHRPWEQNVEPLRTVLFEVTVQ